MPDGTACRLWTKCLSTILCRRPCLPQGVFLPCHCHLPHHYIMLHEICCVPLFPTICRSGTVPLRGRCIYLHKYVLVLAVVPFVACVVPLPASNPSRTGSVGEASVGIHPELTFLFRYCYNMGFRCVFPQTFKEWPRAVLLPTKSKKEQSPPLAGHGRSRQDSRILSTRRCPLCTSCRPRLSIQRADQHSPNR